MRSIPTARRLLPLLSLLALAACEERPTGQGLVIQNPTDERRAFFHDFGELQEGDEVRHTFELLNTDAEPVAIRRVSPACVCTLGRVWSIDADGVRTDGKPRSEPVLVVPSGARAYVEIALDTSHVATRNVDKLALVHLLCDSPTTPRISFELHTVVRVALQATPRELELGQVPVGAGGVGSTTLITALPGSLVSVLGIGESSPGLEVSLDAVEQMGERTWIATAHVPPGEPTGLWSGWFEVQVSGDDGSGEGPPFRVPVRALVVPDVVLQPSPLAFSVFDAERGAWSRATLRALVPGDRVKVLAATVTGDHGDDLEVKVQPLDPDANGRSPQWAVEILAPPALEGMSFAGTLRIELDHESVPEIQAQYVCRPRR